MARPPDQACKLFRLMQQIERSEIIYTARIVAPALAGAEKNAGINAQRGLRDLYVEAVGVQSNFARNGDSSLRGPEIIGSRNKTKYASELLKLPPRMAVKEGFPIRVIGHRLPEIEPGF